MSLFTLFFRRGRWLSGIDFLEKRIKKDGRARLGLVDDEEYDAQVRSGRSIETNAGISRRKRW